MKRLTLALVIFILAPLARATDIYIAQVAAGGGTGLSSCANALAVTYFNNAANWSLTPTGIQIGPDVVVHLCGVFTGLVNTTMLTTQGNGTSGHPIIIRFESGAVLSSPAWSTNGAILASNNFITIDGVTNGTIQNTNDGNVGNTSCLAGTCTVQQAITIGIRITGTDVIVQRLKITSLCMHTWNIADGSFFLGNCIGVLAAGERSLITQNSIDSAATGIAFSNVNVGEASFNTLKLISRFHTVGMSTGFVSTGPIKIHDEHQTDPWIWDSADNGYHHNGLQRFNNGAGSGSNNVHYYANLSDGVWGKGATSADSHVTSVGVFDNDAAVTNLLSTLYETRNVFAPATSNPICLGPVVGGVPTCPASTPTNSYAFVGNCTLPGGCTPPNNSIVANNTMVGSSGGGCFRSVDKSGSVQIFNNLCATNSGGNLTGATTTYPSANIDFNLYPGVATSNAFTVAAGNVNDWGTWSKSPYLLDQHCNPVTIPPSTGVNCGPTNTPASVHPTFADAVLSPTFQIGTGSVAIKSAKNLTSMCGTIPELCKGAPSTFGVGGANDGLTLPTSGNWDAGAYPFNSGVSIPAVPTGLTASVAGSTVNLSCAGSTGTPAGYNFQRATVSGGPYTTIGSPATCSFADTGLSNGTYFYVVSAFNSAGTSANSSQVSAVVATACSINLNPSSLAFGSVTQGIASATQSITITNLGTASCSSLSIANPSNPDFTQTNTCSSTLVINATCSATVTFTPSVVGSELSALAVSSNDPNSPETAPLSGTGAAATSITPNVITLTNTYVSKTSASATLTFQNNSGASITFSSIAFSGGTSAIFNVDNTVGGHCTGTLTNGSTCTITINATPVANGTFSSTLVVTDATDPNSPHNIAVTVTARGHKILRIGAVI